MDNTEKAFDFALSTTQQVVSLSTGILALTITFLNDSALDTEGNTRIFLLASWLLLMISVIFGVLTMMALTGRLDPSRNEENPSCDEEDPSVYEGSIRDLSIIQMSTFLLGVLSTVIFGILTI